MSRRISVVDLTLSQTTPLALRSSLEVSPTLSPSSIRSDRSEPYSMPRGTKRKRRQPDDPDDQSRPGTPDVAGVQIESIDLTDVTDTSSFARALAKKRPDEIQAQSPEQPDKPQATLAAYQCPVCMDHLEDSTTTSCGKRQSPYSVSGEEITSDKRLHIPQGISSATNVSSSTCALLKAGVLNKISQRREHAQCAGSLFHRRIQGLDEV
ncbi:hypothetical protein N7539_003930 [Penicillium diatomitis]|uniref:Uncharacterized protein n=1 Tax=Penicillium diatomitis TaxID=2819901 RepID=A0A9X0BXR6_9EURO|nr:uncharacterized protein N7539_003930 [Penicillium diatomitis]KAJ5489040.1 hypothetical protein N7539_003930 [Penicillium diatomitis]